MLSEWKPLFAGLPVENMVWKHQAGYYKAIADSTDKTDSGIFAEFILGIILETLKLHAANETVKLLALIHGNPSISYEELSSKLGKSRATVSRRLAELKKIGRIKRIGSDKTGYWHTVNADTAD